MLSKGDIERKIMEVKIIFIFAILMFSACDFYATGTVVIISEPEGAEIYLDGEDTGMKTDTVFTDVPSGFHTITLKMEGYPEYSKRIELNRDDTVRLEVSLVDSVVKTFGGFSTEHGYSIEKTDDGGYVIVGWTSSFGPGKEDVWLVKLDKNCNKEWSKTYGGIDDDRGFDVKQTSDGGYIIAGQTFSYGVGYKNMWVIKTDRYGNKEWAKTYGDPTRTGIIFDSGLSVIQTEDGCYIIVGYIYMWGVIKKTYRDMYVMKIDENGNKILEKIISGDYNDYLYSVLEVSDGYVLAGFKFDQFSAGKSDIFIIKIDKEGNTVWEKKYGGDDYDYVYSLIKTPDNGFIMAGRTESYGDGESDVYVIKIDKDGNKIWERTYGGSDYDCAYSIIETSDNEFVIAGYTYSYGDGGSDVYVIKIDGNGNKIWERTYGGVKDDYGYDVVKGEDGYIVTGGTLSWGNGEFDLLLIKVKEEK